MQSKTFARQSMLEYLILFRLMHAFWSTCRETQKHETLWTCSFIQQIVFPKNKASIDPISMSHVGKTWAYKCRWGPYKHATSLHFGNSLCHLSIHFLLERSEYRFLQPCQYVRHATADQRARLSGNTLHQHLVTLYQWSTSYATQNHSSCFNFKN